MITLKGKLSHQNVSLLVDNVNQQTFKPNAKLVINLKTLDIADGLALVICTNTIYLLSRRIQFVDIHYPPKTLHQRLVSEDLLGSKIAVSREKVIHNLETEV